jgi:DNA polymerase-1
MSDTSSSPPRLPLSQREAVEVLRTVWPARDGRHNAYLHLAGWLLHSGWKVEQITAFVVALVRATGDEEEADRLRIVQDTVAKKDAKTSGAPQLAKALGDKARDSLRQVAFLLGQPLTLASLAHAKGFTPEYLTSLGVREAADNYGRHLLIPYKNADGRTVRTRKRVSLYGETRFFWIKDRTTKEVLAYGQERLGDAKRLGYLIALEGESDVWAGWMHGLPVLGLPGANAYGKLLADHVEGVRTVIVIREPGMAGEQFGRGIASRLGQLGFRGCLLAIDAPPECKDLCELHQQSGDGFDAAWAAWLQRATPVEILPSAAANGKKPPSRPPEPFSPFPVHCLPCVLERFVREASAALGCDPSYLALPALAVCAALIGNTRTLRIKRSWFAPTVLWTLLVGDSGTMKTPAMKLVLDPVFDLQRQLKLEYEASMAAYEQEHAAWAARKKKAEREAKDKPNARPFEEPEPPKPKRRRLLTSDVTIECLATILNDNPRGLLVYRDELRGWLSSFTRYAGSGSTDMPHWLSMHSAATLLVDRKTGEPAHIHVDRAAVSVTGSIQPGVLAKALTDEHKDAGLAARLLMAMPPRKPKRWTEDEISEDTLENYAYVLGNLAALDFKSGGARQPLALSMDDDARRAWVAFYEEWAQEQVAAEGDLASALSKLEEGAARLALLHHLVNVESRAGDDPDEPTKVGEGSVKAGVEMARWFAKETARIYAMLRESEEGRQGRRLIEYIRDVRGGRVTVQQLRQAFRHCYNSADEARQALDALVNSGLGAWESQAPSPKGGRPTAVFVLHPPGESGEDDDECDDSPRATPGNPETPETDSDPAPDPSNGKADHESPHPETPQHPETTAPQHPSDSRLANSEEGFRVSGCASGAGQHDRQKEGTGFRVCATPGNPRKPPSLNGNGTGGGDRVGPFGGYRLVCEESDLAMVLAALDESSRVAIDVETTGLDSRTDRVRLLSLATDRGVYVLDCFAVDPRPLFGPLAELPLIGHNLLFDLQFLSALGFEPGAAVHDTMLLSQMLDGTRRPKGYHGLAECAERHLGRTLDKTEQSGDWSGSLTDAQLDYAAGDVIVLGPLYDHLSDQVVQSGQEQAVQIEARALPAIVWLARSGAPFDVEAWEELAGTADKEAAELAAQLDLLAPRPPQSLPGMAGWNWSSPEQVKEVFRLAGINLNATDDDALAAIDHPLAARLREYRSKSKLASTYGSKWPASALHKGRLHAGWKQIGADSGRMACAKPNLQNLPTDPRYRACFRAPEGRVLVRADFSQIELRIAAKIARERAMLEAFRTGVDLHTLTAQRLLSLEEVSKEQRKLAKAANFGLLYGMGAKGFRAYAKSDYGLELSPEEAERYHRAFFDAYPGLRRWHRSMPRDAVDTRTLTKRRRRQVTRFTEKLNSPVQGTGADGLKLALALLWERRNEVPGAVPALAVHDEIVVECDADQAETVAAWLRKAMIDAMAPLIEPIPVEVEVKTGPTWGEG